MSINKQVAGVLIKALDGSEVELTSLWKERKAVSVVYYIYFVDFTCFLQVKQ